jgi:predicted AAA+ superfamily ATPase
VENEVIIRRKYADKIKPFIGKQIIKVLTGQRRVGKSYILKQTVEQIKQIDNQANIIYINKEDLKFDSIRTYLDLNNYIAEHTLDGLKNYVLIDEIQDIADFEKALRSLLLNPAYDLYCTGSNANMLSGELSTYLSGRYIEIYINALSFNEFCEFNRLENNNQTLQKFLKYGGLPYLKNLTLEDEIVSNYLKGVYHTIMYRDIIQRYEIRNVVFLENLITFLANNIGHLFSAKKISDYLKSQKVNIAVSQVINYVQYITSSYMLHKVKRTEVGGKKVFEVNEKYYFEDLGLRNAIYEYKITEIEKIIENMVYNHLIYNDYDVKVGQLLGKEIDFVGRKNGETIYVQVCYLLQEESTIAREFGNLEKIQDNYPKMVVSMDEFAGNSRNGIQHIYLRDFVSNYFIHNQ